MTEDLSNKVALCYDTGLFIPVARRLARDFGRVYYHTDWQSGFPVVADCKLGDGFGDIIRCDDPYEVLNAVDLYCFPDQYHGGFQCYLESLGKRVWGCRNGGLLEIDRELFLNALKQVGLNVPEYEVIVGMTRLRDYLMKEKDKYIKISKYRGNFETCHWRSWEEDEQTFDAWAVEFGAVKDEIRFLVFEPIGDSIEIGADMYCIDGNWPKLVLRGDEAKDKSYLGAVTELTHLPDAIVDVLVAFYPLLAQARYRGAISMELRGEGDTWYFTDFTARFGLPSTASQLNLWRNFSHIVWHGANGDLINPETSHLFTAESVLTLGGESGCWKKCVTPKELDGLAQLSHCCIVENAYAFPPHEAHETEIGWLQASGDSVREAIEQLKDTAELLPKGVTANIEALVDLLKEVQEAEEAGAPLTDSPIPEPEVAIQ